MGWSLSKNIIIFIVNVIWYFMFASVNLVFRSVWKRIDDENKFRNKQPRYQGFLCFFYIGRVASLPPARCEGKTPWKRGREISSLYPLQFPEKKENNFFLEYRGCLVCIRLCLFDSLVTKALREALFTLRYLKKWMDNKTCR